MIIKDIATAPIIFTGLLFIISSKPFVTCIFHEFMSNISVAGISPRSDRDFDVGLSNDAARALVVLLLHGMPPDY